MENTSNETMNFVEILKELETLKEEIKMRMKEAEVDFFDNTEVLPQEIKTILDSHQQAAQFEDAMDYKELARLLEELQANGWTFEYGLDAIPYGLRPMTEDELEQLEK